MRQVILNLLRNAGEAMLFALTPNPQIIIETSLFDDKIQVDIIDNGPGCTPEISTQLFTPYFTTKQTGMGMGLAICRTIIEALGGDLTLYTDTQAGAWFKFYLPLDKNNP